MWYCRTCGKQRNWPEREEREHTTCDLCGLFRVCTYTPVGRLPLFAHKKGGSR